MSTVEQDGKIFVGKSDTKPEYLTLKLANRHGLIAGATGTGKTVTLQVLAEGFSRAGVPVFALAMLTAARSSLIPTVLYALPGLLFLVRWWPVTAPYNLDLMFAVFPGLFAACWVVASRHRTAMAAFALLMGAHALLWTMVGGGLFTRVWVTPPP